MTDHARSVHAADFDNDGDNDIVFAHGNVVSICLNRLELSQLGSDLGSTQWYFVDGDTRQDAQTYLLVNNVNVESTTLTLTLLFEDREPLVLIDTAAPFSRYTFRLQDELPGLEIEPTRFSGQLDSTQPVFAERAMYWLEAALRDGVAALTLSSDLAVVRVESNDLDEGEVEVELSGAGIVDYMSIISDGPFKPKGRPGGPFTPESKEYIIANNGPSAIDWALGVVEDWHTVAPSSGALGAGESTTVTIGVTANANSLSSGVYTDYINFTNSTSGFARNRLSQLTVSVGPEIIANPTSFSVSLLQGEATTETLNIANNASAETTLSFQVVVRDLGRSIPSRAQQGLDLPSAVHDFTQMDGNAEINDGRILVRFAKGMKGSRRNDALRALAKGSSIEKSYQIVPNLCLVKLPAGSQVKQALRDFNKSKDILYAEPDYMVKASETTPNDTHFSELWGMHNTGQTDGMVDADIDAPEAWDIWTGDDTPIVVVIDTGVDYNHVDLAGNMWINEGEIPGNSIDDDGNGYVDDVYGYDFCNYDGDPMDDNDHGTHCAGTIGAVGNNNEGVAGVCWDVRIMALKFLNAGGSGWNSDAISCMEYAMLMHANIMSNSWGGGGYDQSLKDAIDAAGDAGILFIAAAGNNNGNDNDVDPSYPSSYGSDNVIAVLATDSSDAMSVFSNYGLTSVDIGAPGSSILSCVCGGGYEMKSGASMATPHVAGACALMHSFNPYLSSQEIKNILLETADPTLPGLCVSGGRLNVAQALYETGAAWLTIIPESAEGIAPGAGVELDVGFHAGELSPGDYYAEALVVSNDFVTPVLSLPTTMTILPDDLRISTESSFVINGVRGRPFSPMSMEYVLTNTGSLPFNWTVAITESWLSLSSAAGALSAGASTTIHVELTSQAFFLPQGSHTDKIVFQNTTSGAIITRTASIAVEPIPSFEIYFNPLDSDPGWLTEGQWQFGIPQGGGSFNGDPTSGHTGDNVYGYNLAGDYTNDILLCGVNEDDLNIYPYSVLTIVGEEGGPFTPSTMQYTLINQGKTTFDWTVSNSADWLDVATSGGMLAAQGLCDG